ncbi:hypothetical protein [Deminuibacter soli]|uniref:Uncharacterized protein n=1 Tax=Deminuibacter soli TaxID=2291815 RepID=A0A3E1NGA0_9BACT|nr:hypothetical protein [Deminuibacter soli]RFM26993.1 hypothetical protein DXN05_16050 [Deminuibacter soli]
MRNNKPFALARVLLALILVFNACKKKDTTLLTPEGPDSDLFSIASAKAIVEKDGGNFSQGVMRFADTAGQQVSIGRLNWEAVNAYEDDTAKYIEVPFKFENKYSASTRMLITQENFQAPSFYSLVVKQNAAKQTLIQLVQMIVARQHRQSDERIADISVSAKPSTAIGLQLYFDTHGKFITQVKYYKGQVYTQRGGTYKSSLMGGDPCVEVPTTTYEVSCPATPDGTTICIYTPYTTYQTVCPGGGSGGGGGGGTTDPGGSGPTPGGGGNGGGGIIVPDPFPPATIPPVYNSNTGANNGKISCRSFVFIKINSTTNWQEAGVSGIQFVADWLGMGISSVKPYGTIYVGTPTFRIASDLPGQPKIYITNREAAYEAANAANAAGQFQAAKYAGISAEMFEAIPKETLAIEFRNLMQGFLSDALQCSCTVSLYNSSNKTVVMKADWSGDDSCNGY